MEERVQTEIEGGVAVVTLNRPEKLNALDLPMFEALTRSAAALADQPQIRAVVLRGAGRAFCAGLDVASFAAMAGGGGANLLTREQGKVGNFAQRVAWVWQEIPVPVIAAVHGVAFGGGLQIALGADLRIVAPDCQLSIMEIKWGLIPDMAGTQTLRRLVRLDIAKELTFTGRIVSGEEAVQLGLATRTASDPFEASLTLAREIAARSPDAVRAAKRLWNEATMGTVSEGLALEERLQLSLIGRANQIEAVQANLEKRAPRFQDPSTD
ncbi:MAG: crotonase/enoyl-CoA hydratase family protein [Candidatus Binatia bacterium]|nr:crotonase/enoyl-CoA hydratase family protein [Candidatus Binatia bacterium]